MLPEEVVQELCQFAEPERAIHWMQTCYQAATSDDDVTQISLWTAYRTRFGASVTKERPLLQAADLIKMVNTAFPTATAMVMQGPDGQRFIIRGIRPRESPVTPSGKVYTACKWMVPAPEATALNGAVPSQQNGTQASQLVPCAHQCVDAKTLYEHILQAHVPKDGAAISTCWQGCTKYAARAETDTNKVALHARVHLPKAKAKQATSTRTSLSVQLRYTAHDDKGEARGVALLATAILKNLAKAEPALFQGADVSPFLFEQALMTNLAVNPVLAAQSAETLCQLAR
jgi:chromatin structure-remodeling complex subunit RSC9